jgi:hypothetical protein
LEFDKNNCRWNFIEEETADEISLYVVIDELLKSNPGGWKGTATELCDKLAEIDENFSHTPLSITKQLKSEEYALRKKYGIDYQAIRTKEARLISLKKI